MPATDIEYEYFKSGANITKTKNGYIGLYQSGDCRILMSDELLLNPHGLEYFRYSVSNVFKEPYTLSGALAHEIGHDWGHGNIPGYSSLNNLQKENVSIIYMNMFLERKGAGHLTEQYNVVWPWQIGGFFNGSIKKK